MTAVWQRRADELDARDPLGGLRARFGLPDGLVYLDGNSLGPPAHESEAALRRVMAEWRERLIAGWTTPPRPWYHHAEYLAGLVSALVGATPAEVAVTGSTTVNLHQLVATFFRPRPGRSRILADALNFPSDLYALAGQLRLHDLDPARELVLVPSRDGRTLSEADIVAAMEPDVALAVFPSVLYRSGQLLDLGRLAAAARARGITIGFDLSHSVGVLPHRLGSDGIDFAFWCHYKYVNGGPGAPAGLFVAQRHHGLAPGLPGWWGSDKEVQFLLSPEFTSAAGAGRWQIGTPGMLGAAALEGALAVVVEAGIDRIRAKSLALTGFLIEATAALLLPLGFALGTPREPARRGGHVAIEHDSARQLVPALRDRGVVGDFRPPNVIRLAPAPLYNTFTDVAQAVVALRDLARSGAYRRYRPRPGGVT